MVLFLHNTSRVDDEPYPNLLLEKGFRGFPSLAFMDADGNVIASPEDRSVAGFEKTLEAVTRYMDLKTLAAGGDVTFANDLFIAELQLGKLEFEEAKRKHASLKGFTEEQQEMIAAELVNLEVMDLLTRAQSGAVNPETIEETFAGMAGEGRVPTSMQAAATFWQATLNFADRNEDAKLYERSLNALKEMFGDDERNAQIFERWDARLKELKGGNT